MKGLLAKRTFRAKMLVGVGALLTKKKLKCQTCGEYNDTGNAEPFTGPEARKWRKVWEKDQARKTAAQLASEQRAAAAAVNALHAEVAKAQAAGIIGDELDDVALTPAPLTLGTPAAPAGWHVDPHARHELRYWDGSAWTAHVSDRGVQGVDVSG
ncbi:MAG: DUF2510 domain-containing protein [Ilumatobacteraceae bacterium]